MLPRRALFLLFAGLPLGCSGFDMWNRDAPDAVSSQGTARHDSADLPAPRINAATHLAAGQVLEQQNKLDAAVEQYEKAISTDPRLVAAYNRLGITYEKMRRLEDSERVFRQGLEAVPDAAILRNNLGYSLMLRNRLEAAETEFRLALESSPEFRRARMNLAITLARTRRPEASLDEFKQAVPEDVAHYNVGVICLDLRDYERAEQSFRQALACNPECEGAKEFLARTVRLAERARDPADEEDPVMFDLPLADKVGLREGSNLADNSSAAP
ncbi:MAG: tetratricopeptide repeat protein [Planctomycetota bacterium]